MGGGGGVNLQRDMHAKCRPTTVTGIEDYSSKIISVADTVEP